MNNNKYRQQHKMTRTEILSDDSDEAFPAPKPSKCGDLTIPITRRVLKPETISNATNTNNASNSNEINEPKIDTTSAVKVPILSENVTFEAIMEGIKDQGDLQEHEETFQCDPKVATMPAYLTYSVNKPNFRGKPYSKKAPSL